MREEPTKDAGARSFQEKWKKVIHICSTFRLFTLNACEAGKPETFEQVFPTWNNEYTCLDKKTSV